MFNCSSRTSIRTVYKLSSSPGLLASYRSIDPKPFHRTIMTTPEESKNTPTKQPSQQEQKLIDDILQLYCLNPSHEVYSHYAEDAVFHDPVSIAKGKESIMSQFNGMPKIFARSETKCTFFLSSLRPSCTRLQNGDISVIFAFRPSLTAVFRHQESLSFCLNTYDTMPVAQPD